MISCVVVLPLAETIPGKLAWEGREELGRESSVGHLAFVLAHMQVVEDGGTGNGIANIINFPKIDRP